MPYGTAALWVGRYNGYCDMLQLSSLLNSNLLVVDGATRLMGCFTTAYLGCWASSVLYCGMGSDDALAYQLGQ